MIDREIQRIKQLFFEKNVLNETDFRLLLKAHKITFKMKAKDDLYKTYFACLQSLVYLASHMKMPYAVEEKNLSILFTELAHEQHLHGSEIWIDEKEGINIFHVLARSQVYHEELFHQASKLFNEDLASMLLHRDKHGFTPLNTACKEGHINTVEALLNEARGALSEDDFQNLLHQQNSDGYTPFMSAYHTLPLLKMLSEQMKRLELTDITRKDNTVLTLACLYGKYHEVAYLLKKAEKDNKATLYLLEHQNDDNEDVLVIALRKKDYASLDTILEYAAKHMDPEELRQYCLPLIKSRDLKAITSLLYQARQHCSDFERFIFEPSPALPSNLMELWAHRPQISQRIRKYLDIRGEVPASPETVNHEQDCAADSERSAVGYRS